MVSENGKINLEQIKIKLKYNIPKTKSGVSEKNARERILFTNFHLLLTDFTLFYQAAGFAVSMMSSNIIGNIEN